jgi:hypothetical protein
MRDTLLDRERCATMLAKDSGDNLIRRVAQIPLRSIQTIPYKIRPLGQTLYAFLAPLQRYALALAQLDLEQALRRDRAELEVRRTHLAAQADISLAQLRDQLSELRWRYGEIGLTWREVWDPGVETLAGLTHRDLATLLEEIEMLHDIVDEHSVASCDLWAYQRLRQRLRPALSHPYWLASDTLQSIQRSLLRGARGRYRRVGKVLTETREYRGLTQVARSIWEEVGGEATSLD